MLAIVIDHHQPWSSIVTNIYLMRFIPHQLQSFTHPVQPIFESKLNVSSNLHIKFKGC